MLRLRHFSYALALVATAATAQVTVYVQQPATLEGPLDFTWADDWGQTPDLNNTANNVTAFCAFVDDGTTADSLGCNSLVNGSEITGKIAVIYRGTCEFGAKALNAQNAGAVAVVIINNVAGAPVGMGAGTQGPNVTIPVVMISQEAGALLRDEILAGNLELFIGSQSNFYANNLGFYKGDILVPRYGQINSLIAQNAAEFSVPLGAMMHNYGSAAMDNATVRATVIKEGNTLYDETSAPVTLNSGDSLYVTLPDFSEASGYSGHYQITYTLQGANTDDFAQNNSISVSLTIGDKIGYAPSNPATSLPQSNLHVVPANNTTGFRSCMAFKDANASRLAATGIWFTASRAADTVLTDEVLTGYLYQWNDAVTAPNTLPTEAGLSALATGEYIFTSDAANTPLYMPFFDIVTLTDNQWYLACLDSYSGVVWHGWDNSLNTDRIQTVTNEPMTCLRDGATWYNGFTGITGPASVSLQVINANSIGIEERTEVEVTPYPNPTRDFIQVPVKGFTGSVALQLFDSRGSLVNEQRTAVGGEGTMQVDVRNLSAGTYLFKMQFENGKHAEFRVQVSK